MKTITIAGRLTKDAELKRTQAGDPILQFSVAVDHYDGRDKSTMFFDCALFGKRGQSLEQLLAKGVSVCVSGDFSTFKADNGNVYLKVRANEVTLQGGSQKRDETTARQERQERPAQRNDYVPATTYDDEIPFMMEWR